MFLVSNDNNLTIPNFLQALGFVPPAGMTVDALFVDEDSSNTPEVQKTINDLGFEPKQINPQYRTVEYQKKDPTKAFSFSDNYVAPEQVASELAEFPKHVQANGSIPVSETPPTMEVIKSPVKAVTIVEDYKNKSYLLRIEEDNMPLPKGTIIRMKENEDVAEIETEVGSIAKAAMYAHLFANDLKHMHIHATGTEFDRIHLITQELYEELTTEIDELSEIAVAEGEKVPNMSDTKSYVDSESEWQPVTEECIDWPTFTDKLCEKGKNYLDALKDISSENSQTVIDDYIHFWSKEIDFKNAARLLEPMESDYLDIMSDYNDEKEAEYAEREKELSDDTVDMYTYNDAYANNKSWDGFESLKTDMVTAVAAPEDEDEEDDEDESEEA